MTRQPGHVDRATMLTPIHGAFPGDRHGQPKDPCGVTWPLGARPR
jgi:uncharacterized glyoxalase superfamily protein PhnB